MSSLPSADQLRRALDRERVRAVRDARYRTNIDFAITKARTIVIGLAITASITMGWPLPAARALSPILTDVTAVHHQALCTTATSLGPFVATASTSTTVGSLRVTSCCMTSRRSMPLFTSYERISDPEVLREHRRRHQTSARRSCPDDV